MTLHVQRGEPNRASSYILVIGLLCALGAFLFEAYRAPRTVYVEAMPESAKLYVENNVVCETLPCEITLQHWPKAMQVMADRHYSQDLPISIVRHFTSRRHSYEVRLKAFPYRAPEPKITYEEINPPLPQPELAPKPKYIPPPPISEPKPRVEIPWECMETPRERLQIQNRSPVLCYSEDDKAVTHDTLGECYASYWVSVKGHAQKLQEFFCMHDEVHDAARRAFKNRIYLPGLKNGKLVEKAVQAEIKYGPRVMYTIPPKSDAETSTSVNGDAKVLSCPHIKPPRSMTRSGHCIFEFDLTKEGHISQIRQTKCTHAELGPVVSKSFKQCHFKAARTDGVTVERPYMKYQLDVPVFDSQGRKTPIHASFGESSFRKPYVVYE